MPLALVAGSMMQLRGQEQRPNLLYIFTDQHRLNALSLWNDPAFRKALTTVADPVHTPHIDKLARQSMVFTQACSTCPLSSPHRAMLMTGMYPETNGVDMNCVKGRKTGVPDSIVGMTDVLAAAGYETAYVGKTHWARTEPLFDKEGNYVGSDREPGGYYTYGYDTYIPEGRGRKGNKFWFQQLRDSHFNTRVYSNRPELVGGKKDGEVFLPHRFSTSVEADVVVEYLRNTSGWRDASRPFSLIWAINPPHPAYSRVSDCKEEVFREFYQDLTRQQLLLRPNVVGYDDRKEMLYEGTAVKDLEKLTLTAKVYFSLIKSVDDEIGRVLDVLEEEGLTENTIVVFAADHGEMMGSHGRMEKGVIYDEAFVIPFIVRYPQKLKPQLNDLLIGAPDIMPTLLGMMGLADRMPSTVMGTDYSAGLLTGKYGKQGKPQSAFYYNKREKGVRTDRYSYVVRENGQYQLFDNRKDPYQMNSITLESLPAKQAALLKSELGHWLQVSKDAWARENRHSGLISY